MVCLNKGVRTLLRLSAGEQTRRSLNAGDFTSFCFWSGCDLNRRKKRKIQSCVFASENATRQKNITEALSPEKEKAKEAEKKRSEFAQSISPEGSSRVCVHLDAEQTQCAVSQSMLAFYRKEDQYEAKCAPAPLSYPWLANCVKSFGSRLDESQIPQPRCVSLLSRHRLSFEVSLPCSASARVQTAVLSEASRKKQVLKESHNRTFHFTAMPAEKALTSFSPSALQNQHLITSGQREVQKKCICS